MELHTKAAQWAAFLLLSAGVAVVAPSFDAHDRHMQHVQAAMYQRSPEATPIKDPYAAMTDKEKMKGAMNHD